MYELVSPMPACVGCAEQAPAGPNLKTCTTASHVLPLAAMQNGSVSADLQSHILMQCLGNGSAASILQPIPGQVESVQGHIVH